MRTFLASFFSHSLAVVSALYYSAENAQLLGIRRREVRRYVKKSLNLALCYVGFGTPGKYYEAWKAGEAAFFCCAYDVVTDWRDFDLRSLEVFKQILLSKISASTDIRERAIWLYDREFSGRLAHDGLERGSVALRLVLRIMECELDRELKWGNLDEIGELLQIADDVLDYEEDCFRGDLNCLTSARCVLYLEKFTMALNDSETRRIFGNYALVLLKAIQLAHRKAQNILEEKRDCVIGCL